MKKSILLLSFICLACVAIGQTKPKKRIHRDTIKTIQERIEYAPDTIPVYFKEVAKIAIKCMNCGDTIVEQWRKGFVVWQTYKTYLSGRFTSIGTGWTPMEGVASTASVIDEYEPTKGMPGIFLYEDKTRCKNLVIYSIKR